MRKLILTLAALCAAFAVHAQESDIVKQADGYEWPTDPQVLAKLSDWQDLKFGALIHWGLYAVPGIVESWSICNEDWITRPEGTTYEGYKQWYWDLSKVFNPYAFDPVQWADAAQDAGMKYVIFTTKHHDGFCMFDSEYTDFSIAKAGPFARNPKKDVAKHVFQAFRDKNFMIGAYYSKPDWHHPGFWNPYYATPNRRPNYKIADHPDWWKSYVDYTQNQLNEITGGRYGQIDILWLDGGWINGSQVGIESVLEKARARYPGMICVDRTIKGPNENYQTPERRIPDKQVNHPWESCLTHSNDWGWVPNAPYKSARTVIGILAEIVAKGGCLVLGIGPNAQGLVEEKQIYILKEIGEWLRRCGSAIYGTVTTEAYNPAEKMWVTASKDGKTHYAIYALADGEKAPAELSWEGMLPVGGKVTLLNTGTRLTAKIKDGKVTVTLPKNLKEEPIAFSYTVN